MVFIVLYIIILLKVITSNRQYYNCCYDYYSSKHVNLVSNYACIIIRQGIKSMFFSCIGQFYNIFIKCCFRLAERKYPKYTKLYPEFRFLFWKCMFN